jgi:single-stranded-DNA-specific exonuclease
MKWINKTADEAQTQLLATALQAGHAKNAITASTLARLLVTRGIYDIEAAEHFLNPRLENLHSPYLMAGMKVAVERLAAAIERKERILIYGDYDVDGTTAIVVLKTAIELCGGTADFHVPHRIREGYGIKEEVIERAALSGVRLIVSVDTGIRAFSAATTARDLGIDLIVTDHHLPGNDGVPQALAVLNPNQPTCDYPCKALCGCGVAFKLAQGLMEKLLTRPHQSTLVSFMKVVAIATVADAVPLIGENRIFAKIGLDGLKSPVNLGLKALLQVAQLAGARPVTSTEVAFRIAPRLNAAGRMDVARDVVELFSVKDSSRAEELAVRLDKLNGERQEEERRILQEVETRFEQEPALRDSFCIVIDGEGWHRGVIGITATRVVERYGRPAVVICRDGEEAHGSGRSIQALHLLDALEACSGLFDRYGGHAHAVGFALPCSRVPELRSQLDAYARARLKLTDFEPSLSIDAKLPFDEITPDFFALLRKLEPFGMGNREPIFTAHSVRLLQPPRILKEKHVKLKLAAAADPKHTSSADADKGRWRKSITYDAMGWRLAEKVQQQQLLPGDALDVAFTVGYNDHPDFGGLELTLCDILRSSAADAAPVAVQSASAPAS